jgi:SSS family solute:Na+ symporter
LLQQLNGIFFIPVASIMLAGFFLKNISATAAKSALFFGLAFYIITTFILKVDIHFIHIWGIEFVLNMIIMFTVSHFYPRVRYEDRAEVLIIEMQSWRYTKHFSIALVIITILIYVALSL